jgi:AcrR family transcriptional regulator
MPANTLQKIKARPSLQPGSKGARAKQALKIAARSVFHQMGYANARVQDITEAAGFSLGAFYRYFKDKGDILEELFNEYFDDSYATTFHGSRYDPSNPGRSVFKSILQTMRYVAQNADMMKVLWEISQTHEVLEARWNLTRAQLNTRIARLIHRAQEDEIAFADLEPESVAELLIGMTEIAAYRRLVRVSSYAPSEPEDLARRLTSIWVRTLFLPEATANKDWTSVSPKAARDAGKAGRVSE